jgi:predicted peroxiredoxin
VNTKENTMTTTTNTENNTDKLVILLTRGIDDERATVAWTLANAGVAEGLDVTVFCVSAGVDVLRRGAADIVKMNPLDPSMKELIDNFQANGGTIWACPPCANLRGYNEDHFIRGAKIVGAAPLHALLKQGAATLCV